jgi:hypothetical protein
MPLKILSSHREIPWNSDVMTNDNYGAINLFGAVMSVNQGSESPEYLVQIEERVASSSKGVLWIGTSTNMITPWERKIPKLAATETTSLLQLSILSLLFDSQSRI